MIFLTVGTQLSFDRLIRIMDDIAKDLAEPIFGQIGTDGHQPQHFDFSADLDPDRFAELFNAARVVVAHAGIGTILAAQRYEKPLIVLPRSADLGEHRDDHQHATCAQLGHLSGLHVVANGPQISGLLVQADLTAMSAKGPNPARDQLIGHLRDAILNPIRPI
jgi:UDP-N-acetylglucosamine transferase subunit ALG13